MRKANGMKMITTTTGRGNIFKIRKDRLDGVIRQFSPRIREEPAFKKVFWLQPPGESAFLPRDSTPLLTPLALFSPIRRFYPSVSVAHFNEVEYNEEQMRKTLEAERPDLVCFTPMTINYRSVLKLAAAAKGIGATVVCGGHHATFTADLIMKQHTDIDAVCRHQGENALAEIVGGIPFPEIPNLVWRDGRGAVQTNQVEYTPRSSILPDLPNIDYSLLSFQRTKEKKDVVVPVLTQEGCNHRAVAVRYCEFCACKESYLNSLAPAQAVQLLTKIRTQGFEQVDEISQDLTGDRGWFNEFHALAKTAKLPRLRTVSSRGCITTATAGKLAELGVEEVFIGAESGSDAVLKSMGKGLTSAMQLNSIKNLFEHRITLSFGIVLGCTGETLQTLDATERFILEINDLAERRIQKLPCFEISAMIPRPGSLIWSRLIEDPQFRNNYGYRAFSDDAEVAKDATGIITNGVLSFDDLARWKRKLKETLEKRFGSRMNLRSYLPD